MASRIIQFENLLDNIKNYSNSNISKQYNQQWQEKTDEEITKRELQALLSEPPICSKELVELINTIVYKINYQEINQLAKTQFYNANVMKTMSCLVKSLLKNELSYHELLQNTKVLSFPDKPNLLVFFSNFFNGKNKLLAYKYDGDNTLHEGVIGLFVLNSLRNIIPTFIWTYGFTTCNLPIFREFKGKDVIVSACTQNVKQHNDDYIGLVIEYVEGKSLGEYIVLSEITELKILSLILTVLYSIKYANAMYEFVHWDLHVDNIMMRELESESYIYLPSENKYLWVGNKLATIIDLGFSSAKINNQLYANILPKNGINPEISTSPMNDVYKLMSSLLYYSEQNYNKDQTNKNNQLIYSLIADIYGQLIGIPLKKSEEYSRISTFNSMSNENYHIFPNLPGATIDTFIQWDIQSYIEYLENLAIQINPNVIVTKKPQNFVVLSCEVEGNCLSEKQILDEIFNGPLDDIPLNSIMSYVLKNKSDTKIFKKIFVNHLDEIFQTIHKYENYPILADVNLIFVFNDLRMVQKRLNKLMVLTENIPEFNDIYTRSKDLDIMTKKLIDQMYEQVKKSLDLYKTKLKKQIKTPNNQKDDQIFQLGKLFDIGHSTSKITPEKITPEEVIQKVKKYIKTINEIQDTTELTDEQKYNNSIELYFEMFDYIIYNKEGLTPNLRKLILNRLITLADDYPEYEAEFKKYYKTIL